MKVANAKRVKKIGEAKREKRGGRKDKKSEAEGKRKGKKMKRGMKALREVKRYQMMTELLIWHLPFQILVREIMQERWANLKFQGMAGKALPEMPEKNFLLACWSRPIYALFM